MEKDGIIEDTKGPTPWVSELIATVESVYNEE
jgi:hypothetical protein